MGKTALILGITGQDGYYLNQLLQEKGYKVFGMVRPECEKDTQNLAGATLLDGDLTDHTSLVRVVAASNPDEIYNLAGFSHVGKSHEQPELVAQVNTVGVIRLLEVIKNFNPKIKLLQASTYEVFAGNEQMPINEYSDIRPVSPYSIAKAAADEYIKLYRTRYGIYAVSVYLGNHESPLRGHNFVTRKITDWIGRYKAGLTDQPLELGQLQNQRNWGHAKDHVRIMWEILQESTPINKLVCTNKVNTVNDIVSMALYWGLLDTEIEYDEASDRWLFKDKSGKVLVKSDCTSEISKLCGKSFFQDSFMFNTSLDDTIKEMVESDIAKYVRSKN